jgi:hypothetical protein
VNALAENFYLPLRTPAVRDLAWACFTPSLLISTELPCTETINNAALPLTAARKAWLHDLDLHPGALLDHLDQRQGKRLGLYFESLWHFFLQQDPEVELIAHNLPVRDGGRTVGEFDCIYHCHRRDRAVHLELALKFYLHRGYQDGADAAAYESWLGPNTLDRLDLKLQRLLTHQVLLSRDPLGAEVLAGLGVTDPLLELEMKGRLYQPPGIAIPEPAGYNPTVPMHHWCRLQQEWAPAAAGSDKLLPLHREQWLAPVLADKNAPTECATLRAMLSADQHGRPAQAAVIDADGNERHRLFIVPDAWPHS